MKFDSQTGNWDVTEDLRGQESLFRQLGADAFSGVLEADDTMAIVVNGAVIRVTGGTLNDLLGERLTVHESRGPEEPYLLALHENCSKEAKLDTQSAPLDEAVADLSETSFSGYIELSEHVYSGDYYGLFSDGDVKFLGVQSDLSPPIRGEKAKAAMYDEVGIYTVNRAWVDPVQLTTDPSVWRNPAVRDQPTTTAAETGTGDTRVFDPAASTSTTGSTDTEIFEGRTERRDEDETAHETGAGTPSFCPGCGTDLATLQFGDVSFCPNCGFALDDR